MLIEYLCRYIIILGLKLCVLPLGSSLALCHLAQALNFSFWFKLLAFGSSFAFNRLALFVLKLFFCGESWRYEVLLRSVHPPLALRDQRVQSRRR